MMGHLVLFPTLSNCQILLAHSIEPGPGLRSCQVYSPSSTSGWISVPSTSPWPSSWYPVKISALFPCSALPIVGHSLPAELTFVAHSLLEEQIIAAETLLAE
jgi:hypothetical protein